MFPTAGYFRNSPCPFFVHGLCHRPYCHFRHAKKDAKAKRDTSSGWTYGETIDTDEREASQSTENDNLMRIIKNLSPGKKKADDGLSAKKSVSFAQYEPGQLTKDVESKELSSYTPSAVKDEHKDTGSQKIKAEAIESNSDPIPKKVVLEISDLLQITSATDESAKIVEEVQKRKRAKKGSDEQNIDDKGHEEIKAVEKEEIEEKNIFEVIDVVPKKPPKLKDVNFFELERDETVSRAKKKKTSKKKNSKGHSEGPKDSSSDSFENSGAMLKKTFDSYDPNTAEDSVLADSAGEDSQTSLTSREDSTSDAARETVGAGSIKRRIAHNPNIEAIRQPLSKKGLTLRDSVKPSFISPSITSTKVEAKRPKSTDMEGEKVNLRTSFTTHDGVYIGKKRKAHVIEPHHNTTSTAPTSASNACTTDDVFAPVRPQIAVEFGSKVPKAVRQRYLDKMIDEYTPKLQSLQDVYDKSSEEEQQIFNRCSSRQIYTSLCVNAVKRIRELPDVDHDAAKGVSVAKKQDVKPLQKSYAKIAAELVGSITPSKTIIRPPSVSLAMADKKHSSLLGSGKEGSRKSLITNVSDLTEDVFYEHLQKYLTTDEERWDNNYPKESPDKAGCAVFKERKGSENVTKQNCARCGKPFQLNSDGEYITRNECHYHWGKLRRMKGRGGIVTQFSCCQADAGGHGCSVAKLHVADYMGDLDGYVVTRTHTKTNTHKIYSLDCEMCYTSHGLELTRVTVVDFNLSQVLDAFVMPDRKVIDYNTRFSGVTEEDLQDVEIKLKDVHRKLLKKFGTDTILIGHSLESDLRALKIIHSRVVDTALVFPHRLGLPYKRALKTLMGEFLQKIIQENETGHDSYEDAAACMQLMKWKVVEDLKKEARKTGQVVCSWTKSS